MSDFIARAAKERANWALYVAFLAMLHSCGSDVDTKARRQVAALEKEVAALKDVSPTPRPTIAALK